MEGPTCSIWKDYGVLVIFPKTGVQLHLYGGLVGLECTWDVKFRFSVGARF